MSTLEIIRTKRARLVLQRIILTTPTPLLKKEGNSCFQSKPAKYLKTSYKI